MIFNREEQHLMLEGSVLSKEDVKRLVACHTEEASGFLYELYRFLEEWFSDSPYLTVKTSGSTGTPKLLKVRKEQMMQSARLTCEFLGLRQGDSVLLCMPLQYIAGKMVVVRALVAGLNLVIRTPSGHPMADVDIPLRFAAMVPLQVYNTLQVSAEKERLCRTDILIIGGGAIDAGLEAEIRQLPVKVYSTYGMTETLSHIALRQLNGPDASMLYRPFPSVRLSLSSEHTLVIDAPLVCDTTLVTNDVAEIYSDGSFSILGRKDNTINTGGIKVQAEQIEEILRPWMTSSFCNHFCTRCQIRRGGCAFGREGGRCRVTGNKDEGASVQISVTQDDFVSRGYTLDGNGKDQSCRLPATCPHLSDRLLSVFSSLVVSYTK